MSKRPIIGIPTQNLQSIGGVPADLPPSWMMSHRYVQAATQSGGVPWLIPLLENDTASLRAIYDGVDGIFLPGGADIEPESYGAQRVPACGLSDPPRDRVELQLAQWAIEDRKPLLGVCRGLQLVNLAAGGTLVQDFATQQPQAMKHDYFPFRDGFARDHLAHSVRVVEGTRLHHILGVPELSVNSMHHQGIERLGSGLIASAVAPDGVIEAVERVGPDDHFMVAVQWHPEVFVETDPRMRSLFAEFVAAAGEYRAAARAFA